MRIVGEIMCLDVRSPNPAKGIVVDTESCLVNGNDVYARMFVSGALILKGPLNNTL